MVVFRTTVDVDAYYIRHGIRRLRVLQRRRGQLDPVTAALVADWLSRYDAPPMHRAGPDHELPTQRTGT